MTIAAPKPPSADDEGFKRELIGLIPHLRAFARTLTGDPTAADDLAQDAMMKAWDARASYQMGTNMKAWTFMILRNQFYSEKRRSWRQSQLDQEAAERTLVAVDDPEAPVALDELRLALSTLPEEQREALILVGAGGFAYEEAAEICQCAVGTVKSRVSRARRALLATLERGGYARDGKAAGDAMRSILADADRLSGARQADRVVRFRRILGRGLAPPGFQGIRSRLGMAMAIALLPIILLSVIQTNATFRDQEDARRVALQLAAERSATTAQARLAAAAVLLRVVAPEAVGPGCEERLTSLMSELEGYDGLGRRDGEGRVVCASRPPAGSPAPLPTINGVAWFERLRAGERLVMARGMDLRGREPGLVAAIRLERPAGGFDGSMAARVPLSILQPDVSDPALPPGSQAALTDGAGRLLVATSIEAFQFENGQGLEGWVERARAGSAVFEAGTASGRRVYAGAALAGRDVYVLFSAPAPGLLSWARLNPMSTLLLPLGAWLTAFAAVMLLSERIVVRWLDYLERVAAIYARGRFTVRPVQAVNAPSEIRILGRTLDELAEAITLRDRSLTDSLAEKDALMREIHHRVKNNLQIISSLLSMQQRTLTDEPAKAALGDTRQRISALALIYRTLYQGEDIHRADARDFLNDLVGQLVAGEAGRGPLVTSSVEADSLIVDPDKLAPLALWLVEAVSNAQKHAFAGKGGALRVRFKVGGDTSVLEVEDDGPGVDDTLRAGVGRTLMGAFAKQLRGEAELVPGPRGRGTIARMTFPTPEAVTPTDPNDLGTVAARSR